MRARDVIAAINRIINFADLRRQFSFQLSHASRGGGGDNELEVGHPRFDGADEMRTNADFANADGVQPHRVAIRQGLFELGVVLREAFAKTGDPISAPPHPPKVVWRRQRKKYQEQDVVNQSHVVTPKLSAHCSEIRAWGKANVSTKWFVGCD